MSDGNGQLALIERLFTQHRTSLRAFFYRRVRSKLSVPDLVQEVYVRMLRVKDGDAIRNPEGYLFTVATNLLSEQAVLDQKASSHDDLDGPKVQNELASTHGFEDLIDTEKRVRRLREVVAQLPPKCRAAVFLKYQHGMSYQEIATHLGLSTHMVQKYLGRALAHCRRRMASMR